MGHFAKIDDQNVVIDVIVVNNETLGNLPFPDSEAVGIAFLTDWSNGYTNWKQTSYNANFRKNYAGIGYTYDPVLNAFIVPQPYPSWLLDADTCQWNPPISYPTDNKKYSWNEDIQQWVEVAVN